MQKLIEAALPLSSINEKTVSEKTSVQGSPANLHMWWGRSPRYSTQVALLSALIDTSDDVEELRRRLDRIEMGDYPEFSDPPVVFDPFSGFGGIPLIAQKLGLPVIAGDLNPVAVMLTKAATEIPFLFAGKRSVNPYSLNNEYPGAMGLAEDVQYYGEWLKDKAEEKLRYMYPNEPEGRPAAWIWARTAQCPNPACGCKIPLASSFVINAKSASATWAEPVVNNGSIHFELHKGKCPKEKESNKIGTSGARFQCPACGEITTIEYIRKVGENHLYGSQLMAMVIDTPNGKIYKSPTKCQEDAAEVPIPEDLPQGTIPNSGHLFGPSSFGMKEYSDLFTPRQLTMLTTFCDLLKEVQDQAASDALARGMDPSGGSLSEGGTGALAYGQAISIYLSFVIDKIADRNSTICSWNSSGGNQRATFCRQAMPMVWNYAEGNPFSSITGNFSTSLKNIVDAIQNLPCGSSTHVYHQDAVTAEFPQNVMICTELPYYKTIGYAHLSDFFYIWMRRSLKSVFPDVFQQMVTPKDEMTTVDQYYGRLPEESIRDYEKKLSCVIHKLYQCATSQYPNLLFFEYRRADQLAMETAKETHAATAWENLMDNLTRVGFSISAIWPMRNVRYTPSADSTRVLIVVRKTDKTDRITRRGFINTLKREMPEKLEYAYQCGVDPCDRCLVGLGCGLSIFSRFDCILNADGSHMNVQEALPIVYEETLDYIKNNLLEIQDKIKEDSSNA